MRVACLVIAVLACGFAAAGDAPAVPNENNGCVEVEINGERTPSFDCLTQKLRPAKTHRQPSPAALQAEQIVRRPGNQMGLFNHAATGHRMGSAFGSSVLPQRPATPPPVSPVLPPR